MTMMRGVIAAVAIAAASPAMANCADRSLFSLNLVETARCTSMAWAIEEAERHPAGPHCINAVDKMTPTERDLCIADSPADFEAWCYGKGDAQTPAVATCIDYVTNWKLARRQPVPGEIMMR